MAFWNRNKNTVTPEFEEYYMAEKKERVGLAWLLALVTLFASVIAVIGLFFGGRWLYRKINKRNDNKVALTQISGDEKKDTSSTDTQPATDTKTTPDATKPSDDATGKGIDKVLNGEATAPKTETPSSNGTVAGTNTATPNTAQTTPGKSLPNSGPGDMVKVFVITSAAGTVFYKIKSRRQQA